MSHPSASKNSTRPAQKKTVTAGHAVKKTTPTVVVANHARPDRVHTRAFEIYSERVAQGAPGNELSDWLQAESEYRREEK